MHKFQEMHTHMHNCTCYREQCSASIDSAVVTQLFESGVYGPLPSFLQYYLAYNYIYTCLCTTHILLSQNCFCLTLNVGSLHCIIVESPLSHYRITAWTIAGSPQDNYHWITTHTPLSVFSLQISSCLS